MENKLFKIIQNAFLTDLRLLEIKVGKKLSDLCEA